MVVVRAMVMPSPSDARRWAALPRARSHRGASELDRAPECCVSTPSASGHRRRGPRRVFGEHGSLRRGCRAGGLTCACPAATLAGCAGVTLRWASLRRDFAGNSVTTKEGSQIVICDQCPATDFHDGELATLDQLVELRS